MTREEAHESYDHLWSVEAPPVDDVVDDIYDDFESRTCKTCKHFNISEQSKKEGNGTHWIDCDLLYAERGFMDNFGCNRWEENKELLGDK